MGSVTNTGANTANATDSGLPDFAAPPVDETALSIQFSPIQGFDILHFGLFWEKVRGEYPKFEIQPPIANLTELFDTGSRAGNQVGFKLVDTPEIRCWFLDESKNRLVQVQRDRFVHNWRKITGSEPYPRYPIQRANLEKEWNRFCLFLREEKLETPKVNQCEVTYVNHIEYGKGWKDYSELDKVIATLATPKKRHRFLPDPERINMQVTYRLENNAGRLHVAFLPVIRVRDGEEVLQMTLTARGAPASSSVGDIFSWLDLGRKWVVRGFADFTTAEIQKVWGRQ